MTKSIIVVIPARGGSKRVVGKNLRPLAGIPLVVRAVKAALKAGIASAVIVSTESLEIAEAAERSGARIMLRPTELAADTATTEGVLLHALDVLTAEGVVPDWVMTLPPTSPFRKASTIAAFAAEAEKRPDDQDCLMSVTEDRGDFWLKGNKDGAIVRLFPDAPRRQQNREPLYEENSALYLTKTAALRKTGSILGNRVRGLPIDPLEAFDINTEIDFRIAEAMADALPELANV
jgi:CMP-N,N'-diacetyllegionaminic acid synthase